MTRRTSGLMPEEVFISHSSKDHLFAERLVLALRSHKVPVWYSSTNIVGAQQWHDEIGSALERCDWFALILSPNAVRSEWVKRELLFALNDERYRERIVPIQLKACDPSKLSWTLKALQRVDFTGTFDAGCKALLKVWGVGYQSSSVPAPIKRPPRSKR